MKQNLFYTTIVVLLLLSSTTANARRYYFTANGAGALTGGNWATAMAGNTLRTTLASASAGDDFWIAKGTYKPTTTTDRTLSFIVPSGVRVYGAGNEVVLGSRNSALIHTTNATILSGDIGTATTTTDNSYHVVVLANCNVNTLLNGLVVTAGNADGTYPNNSGGGIYTYGNSSAETFEPWIQKTWIHHNSAGYGGGTATNDYNGLSGVARFFDCRITNNVALYGGGCHIQSGNSAHFESVTFDYNAAVNGGNGGAIIVVDSEQKNFIYNCDFTNNSATSGGAVYNGSYTLKCDSDYINCLFAGNYATNGGAMYNRSEGTGGNGIRTYITNSCFQGNQASDKGGAIASKVEYLSTAAPNDVYVYTYNSTFGGNTAGSGGAIYNDVDCWNAIKNSIIWGNSSVWAGTNTGLTMLRTIVEGGYTGAGNVNIIP
jgi:predicted outer membrane repeat protein